jgi:acyl-coenzyme A thioesterase PaaI-like protein
MTVALFERRGEAFMPTEAAGSPWHPEVLHGGSVSGLLGLVVQQWLDEWDGFMVQRLTLDLLRPVPRMLLHARCELIRDGGRLKILNVNLWAGERLVCQARALAQRGPGASLPDYAPRPAEPPPGPEGLADSSVQAMLDAKGLDLPPGLHSHVLLREVTPWDERGRSTSWVRIPVDIVAGESTTPFMRTALLADMGNGAGQLNLGNNTGSINADITLALSAYPASEWICIAGEAIMHDNGLGLVHSRFYDTRGEIGHVLQTTQANPEYAGE